MLELSGLIEKIFSVFVDIVAESLVDRIGQPLVSYHSIRTAVEDLQTYAVGYKRMSNSTRYRMYYLLHGLRFPKSCCDQRSDVFNMRKANELLTVQREWNRKLSGSSADEEIKISLVGVRTVDILRSQKRERDTCYNKYDWKNLILV